MTTLQQVDELGYGVYVATDAKTGKYVVNGDYEHLQIASKKGDQRKIDQLIAAARQYGIETPGAEYIDGSRPVSHEEWEQQKEREADGYVPDKYDLGNLIDEYKHQKRLGA